MNAKDVIKTALVETRNILNWYLSDLSDADFLVRPVPGANHTAWQMGHLIQSEGHLLRKTLPDAVYPELPAGWKERYTKETSTAESPQGFLSKAEYLDLFGKTREATLANLAKLPDADLDRPTPGDMAKFAPTVGAMFLLLGTHTMMHAGQFTVVRRKLGKPVLF